MDKVEELIDELETLGVNLELKDNKIDFTPKSKVTPEMLSRMKDHRDELIAYLLEGEANGLESQKDIVGNEGPKDGPQGLGGWLIFIGIGIVLEIFDIGSLLLQTYPPIFSDGTWEALTTPGSEVYDPLWAPLLIFEIVGNIIFLAFYISLAILFFCKSQWFPKVWIAVALLYLVFVLLKVFSVSFVLVNEPLFDNETTRLIFQLLGDVVIWVPYMLVSKRVKNTFVK